MSIRHRFLGVWCAAVTVMVVFAPLNQGFGQNNGDAQLSDEALLQKAAEQPIDRVLELMAAHERLGKKQMTRAFADIILKKDPTNAQALRVKEGKPMTAIEPGEGSSPPTEADIFSDRITALTRRGAYSQIVRELTRRKKGNRGVFLFQEDLANAYQKVGNTSAAKAAYRELAGNRGYPASQRASARRALGYIDKGEMFDTATAALRRKDTGAAMEIVEKMEKSYPNDNDVKSMKAIVLSESGDTGGALEVMSELQAKYNGRKFPYDVDLAGIHLAAKNYEEASAIYNRIGGKAGAGGLRELEKVRKTEAAYEAIRRGRAEGAVAIADELTAAFPKDPDIAILRGEALLAAGRPGEAIAELAAAKDASYEDADFPGQAALALAYYRTNDLEAAESAYAEILDGNYEEWMREDAVIQSRAIRSERGAGFNTDLQMISEEEGDVQRATVYGHTELRDGWRFWGWGHVDSIELSDTALNFTNEERYEAGIAIERRGNNWNGSLRVGGSEDDVIAAGRLSRPYGKLGSWYLEGAYNERANDSISLEALDGRQHRIEVGIDTQLTSRLHLDSSVYIRQVQLLGDDFGDGWGWIGNLNYTIREADRRKPAFRIGYAGEVHVFDGNGGPSGIDNFLFSGLTAAQRAEIVGDLVEEEINLHGVRGTIEGRISENTSYFLSGAIQYDLFDKEVQYSAGAGLEHFFSDSVKLVLGVEYYSAGQGASASEGVVVGNVGVSIAF